LQSSQSPQNLVHAPEGGALIASGFTARVGRAGGARTSGLVSSGRSLVECWGVALGNQEPNSCPLNGAEGKCLCKWSAPMRLSPRSQISGASRRRLARWLVGAPIKDIERDLVLEALAKTDGNRTASARLLGFSIRTLRNKITECSADGVDVPPPGGLTQTEFARGQAGFSSIQGDG
jgi:hypothetical protein